MSAVHVFARARAHARLGLAVAAMTAAAGALAPASGQGLAVDLSAGSVVYEPLATNVRASNIIGTLRFESTDRLWIYGSGGVPLQGDDSSWASAGVGGRMQTASEVRRPRPGIDLGAQGYLFRDPVLAAQGIGATVDVLPFVSVPAGSGRVEVRAGARGHTLSYAGNRESRAVIETGARAVHGTTFRTEIDAKWVGAEDGGFPHAGASLTYAGRPVQLWARAGKWLDAELDEVSWSAGIGVAVGARATLWGRIWQDAPDPLYWNLPRRSWSVGVTHGLTRRAERDRPVLRPAVRDGNRVVIAIPVSATPSRAVFVAGDFSGWRPLAMTRDGNSWTVSLPLEAGIYRYAFRTVEGRWFVPDSVPDRRDDGFGGHVAVLVIG